MSKLGAVAAVDRVQGLGPPPEARARIVAALATVPELHPTFSPPDTPAAFCAWPKWAVSNYTGGSLKTVATHEYDVLVLLPAGYAPDTVSQGDSLLGKVAAALYPIGDLTTAQPVQVTFDQAQAMPALQLRVIPRNR